jgi:hypothetical protein
MTRQFGKITNNFEMHRLEITVKSAACAPPLNPRFLPAYYADA